MKAITNLCGIRNLGQAVLGAVILLSTAAPGTAQSYARLYTFPGTDNNTSGILSPGLLRQGPDGELYSTNQTDGINHAGTVYKMSTAGLPTALYNFCSQTHCLDGGLPRGGVTLGSNGNFYGTTLGGGAYDTGVGTIFKITPGGSLTKLWDFTAGVTGARLKDEGDPWYPPFEGMDGNFYGTDAGVYAGTYGIIYKITPQGKLTSYPFSYTNGALPNLPAQGTDGNFYGTTALGGDPTCRCGVVYKMTAAGKITVLHVFKGYPSDGYEPVGVLAQGADGNFYGTTYEGGAFNRGTIFKITPAGVYTLLHSLGNHTEDAMLPYVGLTPATDGNLYGTSAIGGKHGLGAIFQVSPAGKVVVVHSFCFQRGCPDGFDPQTPLVQHTDGKFYGSTSGNSLGGSVFYKLDMGLRPFAGLVHWSGKVGTTVEMLGQGFTGTTRVSFNGTQATFHVVSDTYLTATVPAGATSGNISVITPGEALTSNRSFQVTP